MARLKEAETGRVVLKKVTAARSLWQRSVGLLGRSGLEESEALWLEPCSGIHTLGMRFSVDALFLSREGRVLRVAAHVPPWRMLMPVLRCRAVVEMPAGAAGRLGICEGSRYVLEEEKQTLLAP